MMIIQESFKKIDLFLKTALEENNHQSKLEGSKTEKNIKLKKVFSKDKEVNWKCRNCGYIYIGKEAPKLCPACRHPQSYYEVLEENY